jgi:hypothetical protein
MKHFPNPHKTYRLTVFIIYFAFDGGEDVLTGRGEVWTSLASRIGCYAFPVAADGNRQEAS